MSHATSGLPARLVLDWRHGASARSQPCVLCGTTGAEPVPGQGCALPQGLRRDLDHHHTRRAPWPCPADPPLHPRQG